ncbi:MAG: nucleotidyltransferase domain-containing protein [Abitibacteriaceae bacterium]|nr:nucleotidyltransferase domain-containing protein [Abditibacteriaceae bacterium]MBV9864355.1 nucleotidyltransferase domain-containing protein [Abditibacteriaceae bacterium]
MDTQQLAEQNRIFYTRAGSRAYGLATATSDEDFRGVFIGLPANLIGLYPVEHCELSGDNMLFELRKFISLAKDCNPNIIELLFMDESDILLQTEWWQRIKAQRELFLTRKAKFTFSGYAMAQLKKIRGHNRWLHDPQPVEPPEPAKYLKVKPIEGLGHREVFDQTAYEMALKGWRQYWEWKNNRNEKRAVLEAEHGFDTKHAMHLIRLLRMGVEIMRGEGVQVKRQDRNELLAIRNGVMTYEELVALAEEYERQLENLYETSDLPHGSDVDKINRLMVDIYHDYWDAHGLW